MKLLKTLIAFVAAFAPIAVFAATTTGGGTSAGDFTAVQDILIDWTTGSLGQAVALSMVVVGIIAGIARQSLMAFVIGIGGGMGLTFTPDILTNIFGAALPVLPLTGI